jgi:hypothetical protein
VVAPKKAALLIAENSYETVMVGLRAKQAELKAILDKLAGMEAELEVNMKKKEQLQVERNPKNDPISFLPVKTYSQRLATTLLLHLLKSTW